MKKICLVKTLPVIFGLLLISACGTFRGGEGAGEVFRRGIYTPGVYLGYGRGKWGEVIVSVRVDERNITDIEIIDSRDDPFVGFPAMEELSAVVLEENTPDVDVVAGATLSSLGFLQAVEDALVKAAAGTGD
ncbi:MAG: FMN-binding protein [Treponema sp.]|jgi:uncharacterized protein with FMN-binding domain|nr:FMN-binding protein [Treponema sp.]